MSKLARPSVFAFAIIMIVILALANGCSNSAKLVTKSLSEVSVVSIKDYEHKSSITLNVNKDKEKITELYNSVDSTQVTDHSDDKEGQNSDPKFIITFQYQDGTQDEIKSTETEDFIYRNLSTTGWIGGKNPNIHHVIDEIIE
jgi:hypothetical protein